MFQVFDRAHIAAAWFGDSVDDSIYQFHTRHSDLEAAINSGGDFSSVTTDAQKALQATCRAMNFPQDCGGLLQNKPDNTDFVVVLISQGDFAGNTPFEVADTLKAAEYKLITVAVRASLTGRRNMLRLASSSDTMFSVKHIGDLEEALASVLTLKVVGGTYAWVVNKSRNRQTQSSARPRTLGPTVSTTDNTTAIRPLFSFVLERFSGRAPVQCAVAQGISGCWYSIDGPQKPAFTHRYM